MINPTEKDINRIVIYRREFSQCECRFGVITSFNDYYVFVRYGEDRPSKGTCRKDLEWAPTEITEQHGGGA